MIQIKSPTKQDTQNNIKSEDEIIFDMAEIEIQKLDKIAKKTKEIFDKTELSLYDRLKETYAIYYSWMRSNYKTEYFEHLDFYLNDNNIRYKSDTSEANKMAKAILGEENRTKASKYGKHMDTAFRQGIMPNEYSDWMEENGIEIVSRRQRRIKKAKIVSIESKGDFARASALIFKWLEIREAKPLATAQVSNEIFKNTATNKKYAASDYTYEISICKRRKDQQNNEIVDTLWILPKTNDIESMYLHQLAHAVYNNLDELEAHMANDELEVLGSAIDQLMWFEETVQLSYQQQEHDLELELQQAMADGEDISNIYARHKIIKPKMKNEKIKSKRTRQNNTEIT